MIIDSCAGFFCLVPTSLSGPLPALPTRRGPGYVTVDDSGVIFVETFHANARIDVWLMRAAHSIEITRDGSRGMLQVETLLTIQGSLRLQDLQLTAPMGEETMMHFEPGRYVMWLRGSEQQDPEYSEEYQLEFFHADAEGRALPPVRVTAPPHHWAAFEGGSDATSAKPDEAVGAPVDPTSVAITVFDQAISSDYNYFVVTDDPDYDESADAFRGQANPLVGAAVPRMLVCRTGRRSGPLGVRIEWWPTDPPISPHADDVVEVSCVFHDEIFLATWAKDDVFPIQIPAGRYRMRYSAFDVDAGAEDEFAVGVVDRYLLQFFPSEQYEGDTVRRLRSLVARSFTE